MNTPNLTILRLKVPRSFDLNDIQTFESTLTWYSEYGTCKSDL